MASIFFRINEYFLAEYMYKSNDISFDTSTYGFQRVTNEYDNADIIINKENAKLKTKNTKDKTAVDLLSNKFILLDEDNAYPYELFDDNVSVNDITFPINLNIKYDVLRIHMISGYNFPNISGFISTIYWRMKNNNKIKILENAYINIDNELIYFNPKPIFISGIVFDKYVEYIIPSFAWSLDNQQANIGNPNTFSHIITNGVGLVDQVNLYYEFKEINSVDYVNGYANLIIGNNFRFSIKSKDEFDLLTAVIEEAEDGDYFRYFGQWDGGSIEDYIFSLNSLAGNSYYIIHEITLLEQLGGNFIKTFDMTVNQDDNFDLPNEWIPIVKNAAIAVSFSIEYTLRLYNRADGTSINKSSFLSSFDVSKYGKTRLRLNIGTNNRPLNIVNKIVSNDNISISNSGQVLVKTKNIIRFISNNDVYVSYGNDDSNNIISQSELSISINPFDNILKFNLYNKEGDSLTPIDLLDGIFRLSFIKNDNSFIHINEYLDITSNKSQGELVFSIESEYYRELKSLNSRKFFILKHTTGDSHNKIVMGEWILEE